jgi:hypothetical protein
MFAQRPFLPCASNRFALRIVFQIVFYQFRTFFGSAVGNNFLSI